MSVMYQTLTMPSAGTGEKRHSTCPLGTPALQVLSWYTSLTKPVHILEEGNMASEQGFVDSDSCRGRKVVPVPEAGLRWDFRPWWEAGESICLWRGQLVLRAPELPSLPLFQEKPEIRIFMWNFSIFKHSAGQTKQATGFDLCFIKENACFCSVKLMNAQLREGIWRLVLDCAPQKAADPIPNPWDANWQTCTGWQLGPESGHTQGNRQAIPGHFARSGQ